MTSSRVSRAPAWAPPAALLLMMAAVWLAGLAWARPLTLPDEGRYARVS